MRKDITPRPLGLKPLAKRLTRYASASLIPVLDLRTRERKEAQARIKRLASYSAQKKRLALFFIPTAFLVAIGQSLTMSGHAPHDNGNN